MRALILSAGLGERLRPLTLKRAKPAIEFLNMAMLAFPYYWLDTVALTDVAFNTHHLPESIRHAAMHVVKPATQIHLPHEDTILGSGGGVWNARFHLERDDTFAVANGDGVVLFEEPDTIERMLRFHRQHDAFATMLVCPLAGVGTRIPGVWMNSYGEVSNFGKEAIASHFECLHYASIMFVSRRVWNYLPAGPSNILYDVFTNAIAQGERVLGYRVDNMRWFETGNAAEYLTATRTCLELLREGGRYAQALTTLLDRFVPGFRTHSNLSQLQLVDATATLESGVRLDDFAVIGRNAHIGAGATLSGCVALAGSQVANGSSHKDEVLN